MHGGACSSCSSCKRWVALLAVQYGAGVSRPLVRGAWTTPCPGAASVESRGVGEQASLGSWARRAAAVGQARLVRLRLVGWCAPCLALAGRQGGLARCRLPYRHNCNTARASRYTTNPFIPLRLHPVCCLGHEWGQFATVSTCNVIIAIASPFSRTSPPPPPHPPRGGRGGSPPARPPWAPASPPLRPVGGRGGPAAAAASWTAAAWRAWRRRSSSRWGPAPLYGVGERVSGVTLPPPQQQQHRSFWASPSYAMAVDLFLDVADNRLLGS